VHEYPGWDRQGTTGGSYDEFNGNVGTAALH